MKTFSFNDIHVICSIFYSLRRGKWCQNVIPQQDSKNAYYLNVFLVSFKGVLGQYTFKPTTLILFFETLHHKTTNTSHISSHHHGAFFRSC